MPATARTQNAALALYVLATAVFFGQPVAGNPARARAGFATDASIVDVPDLLSLPRERRSENRLLRRGDKTLCSLTSLAQRSVFDGPCHLLGARL